MAFKRINIFVLSIVLAVTGCSGAGDPANDISQQLLMSSLASDTKPLLIDVRTASEYVEGHIQGAINIPHKQLKGRLAEILNAKDKNIVLYCHSGMRAQVALEILEENNFSQVKHLKGDYPAWNENKLPILKGH